MRIRIWRSLFALLALSGPWPLFAAPQAETPAEHDARMAWFREARFGMFIHWGVYSVPAGEWGTNKNYGEWFLEETKMPVSQYEKFAGQFNPVKFDARRWVQLAKDAGMKYIVITSKHHDGFGIFPSDLTDWCIKSTPFQRDPLKELAEACSQAGLRLCFYHSIMDWHHPDWGTRRAWNDKASGTPDMDRYTAYMKGQLKELLTRYGPIGILWFDGEWESPWTHERGADLYNFVRGLQPAIIINNRVGKGRSGMAGMDQGAERVGDYGTPEQEIPATGFGPGVDWESCMTMNNHWGYNQNDQNWKSTATLIQNLIDCASKGGNYLLNIGPTSKGLFPQACVDRLEQIGQWMKVNREAIYGTSASPFRRLQWGRCTTKLNGSETTLYLSVFQWPVDGKLLVPGLKNRVEKAFLLIRPSDALHTDPVADGLVVQVPNVAPDPISSTVVLKVAGAPDVETSAIRQDSGGTILLPASEAQLRGEQIRYESGGQRDNLGFWFNPSEGADWEVQVTKPGKFEVTASVAAPEKAALRVAVGAEEVHGEVPVTGDYGNFKSTKLGIVGIPSAGTVKIGLRGVADGWHPVNVKSVRLQPVGQ
jgi:alpha-L-fucosidase